MVDQANRDGWTLVALGRLKPLKKRRQIQFYTNQLNKATYHLQIQEMPRAKMTV